MVDDRNDRPWNRPDPDYWMAAVEETNEQQAIIDALMAALEEIVGRADAGYFDGDTAEGAAAIEVGRAALAMARKGG